ncbi:MAG: translation initiation factor IF-2 [Bacteroidota bacterium]|nr:translation initiation factor IF-2 [Bacteroidota bacterium]MDP4230173.1 translation initiation factor IF-2 [Bacteroidota bacterium]
MAADTTEKTKKTTVRNLATEINISHDTLIEFLQKKGYTNIKSIMSKVDEDALELVMKQFGKDRDVTEKRQKKVAAFKEKRAISKGEAAVEEPPKAPKKETAKKGEPAAPIQEKEVKAPQEIPAEPILQPEKEISEEEVPAPEAQPIVAEGEPAEGVAETTELGEEHGEESEEAKSKRKRRKKKTTTVLVTGAPEQQSPVQGLKIKGKIDLEALHPKKKEPMQRLDLKKSPKLGKTDGKPKEFEVKTKKALEEEDRSGKKKRGREKSTINAKEVQEAVKRTLFGLDESSAVSGRAKMRKQRRRDRAETEERRILEQESQGKVIQATEFLTANELANLMHVDVGEIISKCIGLGLMVSINQRLEKDTIQLVADEFGYTIEFQEEYTTDVLEDTPDEPETLKPRPPVVTIMGHVDHGKTSLLDYIRKSRVVAGESGGITQHIGAYEVSLDNGRQISFLDTPGHEAFTAMRARGAQVTDIVILVVAADDSVMPQTWEAISHATAANVPIVIALNKIDRPEANPDRIRQQLSDKNILVEEWGGKYGAVEISARTGLNVDKLLERVLLEADILELKANPDRPARGVIVEAEVDKGRGIQATVLVQKGTLRMGDPFIAGVYSGKVRAMFDERGNRLEEAPPSRPVQLLGFDGIPQAGDQFIVVESDSAAKEISLTRQQLKREQSFKQMKSVISLDDISEQIKEGKVRNLRIILKGDVDGSVEALADSLQRLATSEVKVEIVHRAVGAISENDVRLAAASNAIVIGFHVRPNLDARRIAAAEHVDIRLYSVIYDCINEVRAALEGLLAPEEKEEVLGTVIVREIFKVPKIGTVAGCYVQEGKITRNNRVRVIRDGLEIFSGNLTSLKRFKDDVREVDAGYECGIGLENFNDIKVGDTVEAFKMVEVKRKLEIPLPVR